MQKSFYKIRFYDGEDALNRFINALAEHVESSIGKFDEIQNSFEIIRKGANLYGKIYVDIIDEMINKGYDWAIVIEMLDENHMWRELLEEKMANENFARLKQIVEQGM